MSITKVRVNLSWDDLPLFSTKYSNKQKYLQSVSIKIATVKKNNLIQIGYLEFRTNLRSFRVIVLVFRKISHYLNSKTEFGPGLEQFQQIRTILRFLDPI